jgi:hypothetical protein
MSEQHQQPDWKERLHFLSSAFGVITGVAFVVTILLLIGEHYTLLLFSSFVFIVFLFLWMLDFALRSSNGPIVSLGDLTLDGTKALKEKQPIARQDLTGDLNAGHTKAIDISSDYIKDLKEIIRKYERQLDELKTEYQRERTSLIKTHGADIKKRESEIDELKLQLEELKRRILARDMEAAELQQKRDFYTPKVRIIVGHRPPYLEGQYIETGDAGRPYQYKAYIAVENFGNVIIEDLRVEIVGLKIGTEICPRIPLREKDDTTPYKLSFTFAPTDPPKIFCLAEHIKHRKHITLCTATPETTPTEIPSGGYQFHIVVSCRNFPISVRQRVNMYPGSLKIPFTVTLLND